MVVFIYGNRITKATHDDIYNEIKAFTIDNVLYRSNKTLDKFFVGFSDAKAVPVLGQTLTRVHKKVVGGNVLSRLIEADIVLFVWDGINVNVERLKDLAEDKGKAVREIIV